MNIKEQSAKALNQCIDIANDYTEDEIKKFMPPSFQRAWEIGNEYIEHIARERRKKFKDVTI